MSFFSKDKEKEKESEEKLVMIPIRQIRPNSSQPRKNFDDEELYSLAESIMSNGILQPLSVRQISQREYELIAGERRLRAAVIAGLSRVPCIITECSDEQSAIFALIENLQRVDLGMFEEARGIARLIKNHNLTQEQVAARLGKRQSTIVNKLRLLKLSLEEQEWITHAKLSQRHARALLKIENSAVRKEILSKVITESMSIRETEDYIDKFLADEVTVEKKIQKQKIIIRDLRIFVNTIEKAVTTMRIAGIQAQSEKTEDENYIEYTVRIPKEDAFRDKNKSDKSA